MQPGADPGKVVLAQPEAFSVLLGGQPILVVGRCRIPLLLEKLFERGALRAGLRQNQFYAIDWSAGVHCAVIGCKLCFGVNTAPQRNKAADFDRSPDPILLRGRGGAYA